MRQKNISFEEKSFEEGLKNKLFNTDRAPVLFTGEDYLLSPSGINKWIKGV